MGIEVYLQEQIHPGEILQFKIIIPAKEELIKTTGTVTWSKELKEKMSFIGGIKFFNNASEDTWNMHTPISPDKRKNRKNERCYRYFWQLGQK